jgi:hypothetical protein
MGTYTVNINERTKAGKNLVALLRSLKDVVSISKGTVIDESILDANTGNTQKAKNAKDLINKCIN